MNINKKVCRNVRDIRIAKEQTQECLAYEAEMSVSHLSKIERGITSPTIKTLARIANALEVPVETFFMDKPKV